MIRSLYILPNEQPRLNLSLAQYSSALANEQAILWVDFQGEPNESSEPILRDVFHFHPLAIDDALQETHIPKVDDWESYLYIVLPAVRDNQDHEPLSGMRELDVFLGHNFVVTHHDFPVAALDRVWQSAQKDHRNLKLGADHILYRLTDELVVDYMLLIEVLDEQIEQLEDEIFLHPGPRLLEQIFDQKRAIVRLRRTLVPLREVLNRLARDDYEVIDARDQVYFRDVYDHLVRLHEISEGLRDLVGSSLDTYLSVINNRMNDIMKTLTIITTLFMPLSFVVGFFGMNFFVPDPSIPLSEWVATPMFGVVLAIMLAIPVVMFLWMRRRNWM